MAFEDFHRIFFKGDSWLFSTSDTLIRLFPQQFWFDAALAIGLFTLGGSIVIVMGMWYWEQRHK
jgi:integral membrane protein (TIGR01906 family)